jgi:hypothetical protein
VVARYDAFTLVEAAGDDAERLRRAGADLRDDMRELKLGRREIDPARDRAPLPSKHSALRAPGPAVVQFVGPIKDAWLGRLRRTGARVVTYMAENGYLVSASAEELAAVGALAGSDAAVRAVVPFTAADKLGAGVRSAGRPAPGRADALRCERIPGTRPREEPGAGAAGDVGGRAVPDSGGGARRRRGRRAR